MTRLAQREAHGDKVQHNMFPVGERWPHCIRQDQPLRDTSVPLFQTHGHTPKGIAKGKRTGRARGGEVPVREKGALRSKRIVWESEPITGQPGWGHGKTGTGLQGGAGLHLAHRGSPSEAL